jgi:hypothetical protein
VNGYGTGRSYPYHTIFPGFVQIRVRVATLPFATNQQQAFQVQKCFAGEGSKELMALNMSMTIVGGSGWVGTPSVINTLVGTPFPD